MDRPSRVPGRLSVRAEDDGWTGEMSENNLNDGEFLPGPAFHPSQLENLPLPAKGLALVRVRLRCIIRKARHFLMRPICAVRGHTLGPDSGYGGGRFVDRWCGRCDKMLKIPFEEHF
jgi:hypothetical protein